MTIELAPRRVLPDPVPPQGFRARRRARREAAARDRLAARLAEVHLLRGLLADAAAVVETGWVRDRWYVHAEPATFGGERPVLAACLVGAVVHAGGGPLAARSQPVQRALDLVWHTLHRDSTEPVRWCPAPPVRAAHLRDLVRWNDDRSRTAPQVVALLRDADRVAAAEMERLRNR